MQVPDGVMQVPIGMMQFVDGVMQVPDDASPWNGVMQVSGWCDAGSWIM